MDGRKIDVEKLISEIETRPALWDMREKVYSDRNVKKKCWEEIINIFANEESTTEEKKKLGDELHKKWKNIRDNFARDTQGRKGKSGSGASQKARYIYSQRLQFLVDVINPKKTTNSFEPTEVVDSEPTSVDLESNRTQTSTPATTPLRSHIGKKRLHPVEDRILSSLENYEKRANKPVVEDDNHHFLLSLIPSLASLPRRLNTNCRLEIMQIISKYETIANQSNPTASLPTQQIHHVPYYASTQPIHSIIPQHQLQTQLHQISQNMPIQQPIDQTLPPTPSSSQSAASYSQSGQATTAEIQFHETPSNVSSQQQYMKLSSAPSPSPTGSISSYVSNFHSEDDSQFSVF